MAVMGTFSQFTTARLALYASQASLSVTGNNISNINTPGYTRQRMDLVSLYSKGQGKYANIFNTNVGYGVLTNGVNRLRDPYLDIRFRNENSKLGAADEKSDGLYQIGSILDEVGKGDQGFGVIEAQFGEFFQALQNLKTNIGSEEYDDLVRAAGTSLTAYLRKAASDLQDIKIHKVGELNDSIDAINGLLTNIRDLNTQIRTQGIYGELAPELRDARDLAIDELSSYIPITVTYSMERIDQWTEVEKLTITIKDSVGPNGKPIKLVDGIYGGQITMPARMPVVNENYDAKAIEDHIDLIKEWLNLKNGESIDNAHQPLPVPPGGEYPLVEGAGYNTDEVLAAIWAKVGVEDNFKKVEAAIAKAADKAQKEYEAALEEYEEAKKENPDLEPPKKPESLSPKEKGAIADSILRPLMIAAARQEVINAEEAAGNAKYNLLDADGNVTGATNDIEKATEPPQGIYNYDEKDNINPEALYLMRVEQLVDRRGRIMDDKDDPSLKSQIIALDDVTFCTKTLTGGVDETRVDSNALGVIQAIRETLIRRGEYSSAAEIERDQYATNKRGIPYYELALDSLAQKFADVFNQMNQVPLENIYDMSSLTDPNDPDSKVIPVDLSKKILDANGNPLKDADGNELTWGDVVEEVPLLDSNLEPVPKLDKDGNKIPKMVPKLDEDGKEVQDANGNTVLVPDDPPYEMRTQYQFKTSVPTTDKDGKPILNGNGEPLTQKDIEGLTNKLAANIALVRDKAAKVTGYEFYDGGVLFSNNGDNNDPTGITASNISISNAWSTHTVRMLNTTLKNEVDETGKVTDHTTRADNINHMIAQFELKRDFFAKDVREEADTDRPIFHGSFREVLTSIGTTLGIDQKTTYSIAENYTQTALSLDNDRLSVSGVDLNEEATSMMQFSKSYAAACRLLTTIDSMLDTLINGTAR